MKQTKVIENSVYERIHLRAGDKIRLVRTDGYPDYGVGIVVGFSDVSGCPSAYFYSEQEILAVPFDAVIRV